MGELASRIYEMLRINGIDPYIVSGIIGGLLILFHRRDVANWSNLPRYRKSFIIVQLLGAILLLGLGIMSVFGLLSW